MPMNQPPEPWASALVDAGLTDPRYKDKRPSLGQLAAKAGLHTTTVSRMVHGRGRPEHENVARVADALGVDVVKVSGWVNQARSESEPWDVPTEVHQLSRREQAALTELIRAMAEAREAVVDHEQGSSASMTKRTTAVTESATPSEQPPTQASRPPNPGSGRRARRG